MKTLYCTFEGCSSVADMRGRELCRKHYGQLHRADALPEMGLCVFEGCSKTANFRGRCVKHRAVDYPEYFDPLRNAFKGVNLDESGKSRQCAEPGCGGDAYCKGLCKKHYTASKRPAYISPNKDESGVFKKCSASEGCDRDAISKGLCYKHWERVNRNGSDVLEDPMSPCPVPRCAGLKKHAVTPLCKKCNSFRHRYSLTVEGVIYWYEPSRRVCANSGCKSVENLHMDHDHACCPYGSLKGRVASCGKCVRGWLCRSCNTSLGMLQENPQIIRGLLEYLQGFKD